MKILKAFLASSIGKKQIVAVTGLLLCVFLVTHLAGNLLLYKGEGPFNDYSDYLAQHPLILFAEIGLLILFLGHIAISLIVTVQNRLARPHRYATVVSHGARSLGSSTMIYTGMFTLLFLIVHVTTFKYGDHNGNLFQWVVGWFKNPLYCAFYVAAMLLLCLHISHGFQSAFQTLGLRFPKYEFAIRVGGWLFAVIISAGFASFPLWGLLLRP